MIITETSDSSDSDSKDGEIGSVPPLVVLLVVTSPLLTLFTLWIVMVLCCRCRLSGLLGNPLSWCLLVDRVLFCLWIWVGAGLRLLRASTPCPLLFLPDLSLEGLESSLSYLFLQLKRFNHQRQRPAYGRQACWFLAVVAFLICCSHYRLYSGSSLYFSGWMWFVVPFFWFPKCCLAWFR